MVFIPKDKKGFFIITFGYTDVWSVIELIYYYLCRAFEAFIIL